MTSPAEIEMALRQAVLHLNNADAAAALRRLADQIAGPAGRPTPHLDAGVKAELDALRAELDAIGDLARHPVWRGGGRDALVDPACTPSTPAPKRHPGRMRR